MKLRLQIAVARRSPSPGFSTVEVIVSLCVLLLLSAFVSPLVVRTLRTYQLSDKATRLAGLLKVTRFEAIRSNTKVKVGFQQVGTQWTVWKDSIPNGTPDATEVQEIFGGTADMLPAAAVPNTAAIAATLGGGGTLNMTVVSGAAGFVTFDARGAVDFGGGAWTVYAFFLGSATDPQAGYRAVLVLPSGTTQVWTATATGNWQRTS